MMRGLEYLLCEERLRKSGLISPEKKRLHGELLNGPTRKPERNSWSGMMVIGQEVMASN